jgi:hypothetical protein
MRSSKLPQTFCSRERFSLASLVALLVILAISPAYAATNETSARLTIEVIVMPSLQNRGAVLLNAGTVQSGNGVTFNFAPDTSQATTSRIDVRAVPAETLDAGKETSAPDDSDQSILQTLTVIAR